MVMELHLKRLLDASEKRDSAQALCLLYRKNTCVVDSALYSCSTTRQVFGTVGLPAKVIATPTHNLTILVIDKDTNIPVSLLTKVV